MAARVRFEVLYSAECERIAFYLEDGGSRFVRNVW
jgi:hypothetical protein